jgi:hypothetical protein
MAETITLYEPVEEEERNAIEVELDAGYRAILEDVNEKIDGNGEALVARTVEGLIHQSIQEMQSEDSQIHSAYAELIYKLQETEEIDVDAVVENAIHALSQQT